MTSALATSLVRIGVAASGLLVAGCGSDQSVDKAPMTPVYSVEDY